MDRNFFSGNQDLVHHFRNLDIREAVWLRESMKEGDYLGKVLEEYEGHLQRIGALCAEKIEHRAASVDAEPPALQEGEVRLPQAILDNLQDLKEAGVCGVGLPTRYGGLNLPVTIYAMMIEMVSRADASLQTLFGLQCIAQTILDFGTPEQKWEWLPRFAKGEVTGAMVLTEPDAGSDLQAVSTTATEGADGIWRLNGMKHFITNGAADILLVLARSEEGTTDARGLSLFLVRRCPEVKVVRLEDKLGIHGSPTCVLQFRDAPAELVGKRKFGLIRYVMSLMNNARLSIGAQSVGVMEAIRNLAWDYCRKRRQFGKALAEMPPVWEMLSRMDALTAGCRALLYETCKWTDMRDAWNQAAADAPEDTMEPRRAREFSRLADVLTPILKYAASEAANRCAYDGVQCLGGRGYMREHTAERLFRDARILSIYEGTSQMQVIAAMAGIRKGDLDLVFTTLLTGNFPEATAPQVQEARRLLDLMSQAREALAPERSELLARRVVRGYALILMALLLLKQAGDDSQRLETARRFCWEYLPEVEHEVSFIGKGASFL